MLLQTLRASSASCCCPAAASPTFSTLEGCASAHVGAPFCSFLSSVGCASAHVGAVGSGLASFTSESPSQLHTCFGHAPPSAHCVLHQKSVIPAFIERQSTSEPSAWPAADSLRLVGCASAHVGAVGCGRDRSDATAATAVSDAASPQAQALGQWWPLEQVFWHQSAVTLLSIALQTISSLASGLASEGCASAHVGAVACFFVSDVRSCKVPSQLHTLVGHLPDAPMAHWVSHQKSITLGDRLLHLGLGTSSTFSQIAGAPGLTRFSATPHLHVALQLFLSSTHHASSHSELSPAAHVLRHQASSTLGMRLMQAKACWITALLVVGAGTSGCSCASSLPESKSFCVPQAHTFGHPPAEQVVLHQSGETLMSRDTQTSAALSAPFWATVGCAASQVGSPFLCASSHVGAPLPRASSHVGAPFPRAASAPLPPAGKASFQLGGLFCLFSAGWASSHEGAAVCRSSSCCMISSVVHPSALTSRLQAAFFTGSKPTSPSCRARCLTIGFAFLLASAFACASFASLPQLQAFLGQPPWTRPERSETQVSMHQ